MLIYDLFFLYCLHYYIIIDFHKFNTVIMYVCYLLVFKLSLIWIFFL